MSNQPDLSVSPTFNPATAESQGPLSKLMGSGLIPLAVRLLLGGYFIHTGINKVIDPVAFLKMIRLYEMMPENPPVLLNSIAAVLPWLEIWCGLLLVLGIFVRGSALLILLMLIGFTTAVFLRALNIHQTQQIPFCNIYFNCGCGTGEEWICGKIPKNLGLCVLSLICLLARSRRFSLPIGRLLHRLADAVA